MLLRGLLISFCTAGLLQLPAPGSISVAAWNPVYSGKTFYRLEQALSWTAAVGYCRQHHTDLADLQSLNSLESMVRITGAMSRTEAWIGLFFDASVSGPRWSSGSSFSSLVWGSLPRTFRKDMCATVYYTWTMSPALGADSCSAQKPFICYEDPGAGRPISSESTVSLTSLTLPKRAEVQIGDYNFIRFERTMTWASALKYCRDHYTDLADLQTVSDEEGRRALKPITNDTEAWIGLYFNTDSNSLSWSSGLGAVTHPWMRVPAFNKGLCAGLATFAGTNLEVYALDCSRLRPFICFFDPTGHRVTAEMPPISSSSSGSSEVTVSTTSRTSTGTSARPAGTSQSQVSLALPQHPASPEPTELGPSTQDPHISAATSPTDPRVASPRLPANSTTPGNTQGTSQGGTPGLMPLPLAPAASVSWESPSGPQEVAGTPLATTASLTVDPDAQRRLVTWRKAAVRASHSSTCPVSAAPSVAGTSASPTSSWPLASPTSSWPPASPTSSWSPVSSMSSWPPVSSTSSWSPASPTSTVSSTSSWPPASSTSSWSHSIKPSPDSRGTAEPALGTSVSILGNPATSREMITAPSSAAPSQADLKVAASSPPGTKTAVSSVEGGTDRRHPVTATSVRHSSSPNQAGSKEKTSAPESGYSFGILKADFTVSTLVDPGEMKDHFLREIQEVLKSTLGHKQFSLKWVGFEVNKE